MWTKRDFFHKAWKVCGIFETKPVFFFTRKKNRTKPRFIYKNSERSFDRESGLYRILHCFSLFTAMFLQHFFCRHPPFVNCNSAGLHSKFSILGHLEASESELEDVLCVKNLHSCWWRAHGLRSSQLQFWGHFAFHWIKFALSKRAF